MPKYKEIKATVQLKPEIILGEMINRTIKNTKNTEQKNKEDATHRQTT